MHSYEHVGQTIIIIIITINNYFINFLNIFRKLKLSNVHSLVNEFTCLYSKHTYPSFLFLCLFKDVLFKREKIRNPWIFLLSWDNIMKMQFVLKD